MVSPAAVPRAAEPQDRGLDDRQIAGVFNRGLGRRYETRILGGAPEPVYEPDPAGVSVIRYRADYAASALHELAHWCIAGARRRRLEDYGYWYRPPPRSAAEQAAFLRAEVPVQALEARLAAVCGLPFQVSVDDVDNAGGRRLLEAALAEHERQNLPLPPRGRERLCALAEFRIATGMSDSDIGIDRAWAGSCGR